MTSRKSEATAGMEKDLEKSLIQSGDDEDHDDKKIQQKKQILSIIVEKTRRLLSCLAGCFSCNGKKIVTLLLATVLGLLFWDSRIRPKEERLLKKETVSIFLAWVEANPYWGLGAFLIVIAICVVLLIPIGTPLTFGCGYIYKGVYGWSLGVAVATTVSMAGSALGACSSFLLGRYLMRDRVRIWVKKNPLFDAIDMAVSEHGLKIMAMLYLTPVLPLGPVSYMCGSTSMALSSFALAKIASLPLMVLYVYIGAAAGTLMVDTDAIEHNTTFVGGGILLSACMIFVVTRYVRKELMVILEKEKLKIGNKPITNSSDTNETIKFVSKPMSANNADEKMITNSNSNSDLELAATSPTGGSLLRRTATGIQQQAPSLYPEFLQSNNKDNLSYNSPQKDK